MSKYMYDPSPRTLKIDYGLEQFYIYDYFKVRAAQLQGVILSAFTVIYVGTAELPTVEPPINAYT